MARDSRKAALWNFFSVGMLFLLAFAASRSWNAPEVETVRSGAGRIDTPIVPAIRTEHHPRVARRIVLEESFASELASLPGLTVQADSPVPTSIPAPDPLPTAAPTSVPAVHDAEQPDPASPSPWPPCVDLIERLDQLPAEEPYASWVRDVRTGLDRLTAVRSLDSPEAADVLDALGQAADRVESIAADAHSPELRSTVRRTGYALAKRLAVWRLVHELIGQEATIGLAKPADAEARDRLARAEAYLREQPNGEAWIRYLKLDELDRLLDARALDDTRALDDADSSGERFVTSGSATAESTADTEKPDLARRILRRLHASHLSRKQAALLAAESIAAVDRDLRQWACTPVDLAALLAHLERHERLGLSADARRMADWRSSLLWSGHPKAELLAQTLEAQYRNANIRIQVAGRLLDGWLPTLECMENDVDDDILGARVLGRSQTSTKLFVRLVPDPRRIHLTLEAAGQVRSDTYSTHGPVTFYNQGASQYLATKSIVADRQALHVKPARASVDSRSDLTDLETDFDDVPLIGSIVRRYAEQQHNDREWEVETEVESRVSYRVCDRLDREIHRQLANAEKRYREKLLKPMAGLNLNLEPIDMWTTDTDVALRVRLAGTNQLAAHTPRPMTPEGSLLCVQFHQSAVNNLIERLELDGKETDVEGLLNDLAAALGNADAELPEDLPEGVILRFAPREAVRVEFRDGRATLWIYLSLLDNGARQWKNITVRAFYEPSVREGSIGLARESAIELSGKRLSFRDQVALRAIFTKVLSRNKQIVILRKRRASNGRLPASQLSQFAITDGWISIALAPEDRLTVR